MRNSSLSKRTHNSFKLNSSLLEDPNNVEAITMVTEILNICNPFLDPIDLWNLKVETWKNLLQVIGKKLAMDRNQEESLWQNKLFQAKKELQEIGQSEELELQMASIKHQLSCIQRYKIQGQRIRARMNWIDEGDKGSGYFFNIIKAKHKRERISDILVRDRISNDPEEIQNAFFSFYKNLFSSEMSPDSRVVMGECFKLIPSKISEEEKLNISKDISVGEIEVVIDSLPNGKSPSLDGFPIEFYRKIKVGSVVSCWKCKKKLIRRGL